MSTREKKFQLNWLRNDWNNELRNLGAFQVYPMLSPKSGGKILHYQLDSTTLKTHHKKFQLNRSKNGWVINVAGTGTNCQKSRTNEPTNKVDCRSSLRSLKILESEKKILLVNPKILFFIAPDLGKNNIFFPQMWGNFPRFGDNLTVL